MSAQPSRRNTRSICVAGFFLFGQVHLVIRVLCHRTRCRFQSRCLFHFAQMGTADKDIGVSPSLDQPLYLVYFHSGSFGIVNGKVYEAVSFGAVSGKVHGGVSVPRINYMRELPRELPRPQTISSSFAANYLDSAESKSSAMTSSPHKIWWVVQRRRYPYSGIRCISVNHG